MYIYIYIYMYIIINIDTDTGQIDLYSSVNVAMSTTSF